MVVVAVIISTTLVVAGLAAVSIFPPSASSPVSGLATGLGALTTIEEELDQKVSRSWTLFSVIGVASRSPYTPWVIGGNFGSLADSFTSALATMWACGSLPTPSVWNVSGLSDRSENLTNGFAPFWQFMFVNESSPGELVFALGTYVNGSVRVIAPLYQSNSCIQALGMGPGFGLPPFSEPDLDTNIAGPLAYSAISEYDAGFGPYAVLWTDGVPLIANNGWESTLAGYGSAWGVTLTACGLAGSPPPLSPVTSWHVGVESENGTPTAGGVISTQFNCTLPEYRVTFGTVDIASTGVESSATMAVGVSALAKDAYVNNSQGVAAWMTLPQLRDSAGEPLPASADLCTAWILAAGSCRPPQSGWYAVLESPSGGWLDSYGLLDGSPGWEAPNVQIVSNETLVLLSSEPLSGSDDDFALLPEVTSPQIQSSTVSL